MEIGKNSIRCAILLALILLTDSGPCAQQTPSPEAAVPGAPNLSNRDPVKRHRWVDLYFGHADGRHLGVEARRVALPAGTAPQARAIGEAWLEGPRGKSLVPIVPRETKIRAVYVTSDATAYVDLEPWAGQGHPGGCQAEMLTVFGLVNSLVLNMPEVSRVKILVGGEEAVTLAGHLALKYPFGADLLLIR